MLWLDFNAKFIVTCALRILAQVSTSWLC